MDKRVLELMDTVGLARRYVDTYRTNSTAGAGRGSVSRAGAQSKLIVCDEPVSALDVLIQAQILNLLQICGHSLAYMFITHNLSVVKHISNDICHIPRSGH